MYALGSVHENFDQWGPTMDSLQSRTDRLLILGSTQITSVVLNWFKHDVLLTTLSA